MEKIKLGQLEMLVAAVDACSFSAAASELGCTQSRISHAIAELEGAIGARLLQRSRSGCTPTDAGYHVLVKARQCCDWPNPWCKPPAKKPVPMAACASPAFAAPAPICCPTYWKRSATNIRAFRWTSNDGCADYQDVLAAVRQGMADIGLTRDESFDDLQSYRLAHDAYVLVLPAGCH